MIALLLEHKTDPTVSYGVDLGDGRQLITCAADDELTQTTAAQAAGFSVVFVGPVSEAQAFLQSAKASTEPYRLWDYISGPRPVSPSLVDWTSPSQMRVELVPSVTVDLLCRIVQIDWYAPGAVQVDPFGERKTGTLVLREVREWTEGPLGPVSRADTITAIRTDGTDGESWERTKSWTGRESADRGTDRRKREVIGRLIMWVTVAIASTGVTADQANLMLAEWARTTGEARRELEDNANAAPWDTAVVEGTEPWWVVPWAAFGLDLPGVDEQPATLRDAVRLVLAHWVRT